MHLRVNSLLGLTIGVDIKHYWRSVSQNSTPKTKQKSKLLLVY